MCTKESNAISTNSTVTKSSSSPYSPHPAAHGWRTFEFAKTESNRPSDMTSTPSTRPRKRRSVQASKVGTPSCATSIDSPTPLISATWMARRRKNARERFAPHFRVVALATFTPVRQRYFFSRLRFARAVPLSSLDSPRASNADPFSCLLAFRASRLFSFTAACRSGIGGIGQGLGTHRQSATVLHWCNVSPSSCPDALQGRSIPMPGEGVGIFFARANIPVTSHCERYAAKHGIFCDET